MALGEDRFVRMTAEIVPVLDQLREIMEKYEPSSLVVSTINTRTGTVQTIKAFANSETGYDVYSAEYEGNVITFEEKRSHGKELIQA